MKFHNKVLIYVSILFVAIYSSKSLSGNTIQNYKKSNPFRTLQKTEDIGKGDWNSGLTCSGGLYINNKLHSKPILKPAKLENPDKTAEKIGLIFDIKGEVNSHHIFYRVSGTESDYYVPCRYMKSVVNEHVKDGSRILNINTVNDDREEAFIQINLPYSKHGCVINDAEITNLINLIKKCRIDGYEKMETLKKTIASQASSMLSIKATVDEANKKVDSFKKSLKTRTSELDSAKEKESKSQDELNSLIEDKKRLDTDYSIKTTTIDRLKSEVSALEEQLKLSKENDKKLTNELNNELKNTSTAVSQANQNKNSIDKNLIKLGDLLLTKRGVINQLKEDIDSKNTQEFLGHIESFEPREE